MLDEVERRQAGGGGTHVILAGYRIEPLSFCAGPDSHADYVCDIETSLDPRRPHQKRPFTGQTQPHRFQTSSPGWSGCLYAQESDYGAFERSTSDSLFVVLAREGPDRGATRSDTLAMIIPN